MVVFNSRLVRRALALTSMGLLIGCAHSPPPVPTAVPDSAVSPTVAPNDLPAVGATTPAQSAPPTPQPQITPPAPPEVPVHVAQAPTQPASALPPRHAEAKTVATEAALTPAGQPRYQCLNSKTSGDIRTVITLPTGSERICSRFPAMGPCQYERDACRAKGGRVIRFDGVEITKEVEREYDKQVQRFKLNAG